MDRVLNSNAMVLAFIQAVVDAQGALAQVVWLILIPHPLVSDDVVCANGADALAAALHVGVLPALESIIIDPHLLKQEAATQKLRQACASRRIRLNWNSILYRLIPAR